MSLLGLPMVSFNNLEDAAKKVVEAMQQSAVA